MERLVEARELVYLGVLTAKKLLKIKHAQASTNARYEDIWYVIGADFSVLMQRYCTDEEWATHYF